MQGHSGQQTGELHVATSEELYAQAERAEQQGAFDQAEELYRQVLQEEPRNADAHYRLGLALKRQGRLAEAVASFQQAIYCRPDFPEAYRELGASFQHSAQFHADSPKTYNDLGGALFAQGRYEEALASFQKALRIDPHCAEAHLNVGAGYQAQGKLDEAAASFRQAVACQPDWGRTHSDLGAVLYRQGKPREALVCFEDAVRCQPDFADAHHNLGILHLLLGNYEEGWPEYEWRWRTQDFRDWLSQPQNFELRNFSQPLWRREPLDGRTILLQAEQGLGDTLQFIRYAPLVRERGGRVIVQASAALKSLLRTCPSVEEVVGDSEPLPPFDVHAYLLSLPGIFRTTLATVPADIPYLSADPSLVEKWREELNPLKSFKVGIVWQGSRSHKQDRYRSVALAEFAPLAAVPGVQLFSLQVGDGQEQLAALDGRFAVTDLGSRVDPASFADAAAVVKNLDLVIAVDSAIVHLAGALGVPVWVALALSPDWRWLLERDDSPWYPTARLFRQTRLDDWEEVFQRMAAVAHRVIASSRRDQVEHGGMEQGPRGSSGR
jgi:tetratricopeptide (TPR) repeat protein